MAKPLITTLDYALAFIDKGWRVLISHWPLSPTRCSCGKEHDSPSGIGKHPIGNDWVNRATIEPAVITSWIASKPHCNLSILTGEQSGIFVLDIDPAHGGEDTIRELVTRHSDLPHTLTFLTGSGGYHLIFKHPGGYIPTKSELGPGVDLRGNGGQIIAPPSRNTNGNYTVDDETPLDSTEVCEAPAWLLSLISSSSVHPQGPNTRSNFNILEALNGCPQGGRDEMIFKFACKMRDLDMPMELAREWIYQGAANCTPSFPQKLAEEKIQNAYNKYTPRVRWDKAVLDRKDIPRHESYDWVTPYLLVNPSGCDLPTGIFPEWLEKYIFAVAESIQVPAAMVSTIALGALATAVAKKGRIKVRADWEEPLNIYAVTACAPSTRKSPAFTEITRPIYEYQKRIRVEARDAYAAKIVERDALKSKLDRLRRDFAKSDSTIPPPEMTEMTLRLMQLENIDLPKIITSDTTPEKLTTNLFRNGECMSVYSAEGESVFARMCGYSTNSNHAIYLQGWNGDSITVDRMQREEELDAPLITLSLTLQPAVLRGIAQMKAAEQGLLARFLYCFPLSNIGNRKVLSASIPPEVRTAYSNRILKMLEIPMPTFKVDLDGNRMREQNMLYFDGEESDPETAWGAFIRYEQDLERQRGNTHNTRMLEWLGKLGGNTARIIALLHIAENIEHCESPGEIWRFPIMAPTVDAGIALGKFYAAHAAAAFEEMHSDPVKGSALDLIQWIRDKKVSEFFLNDAIQRLGGDRVLLTLTFLIDRGYIRTSDPHANLNMRNNFKFEVNPAVLRGEFRTIDSEEVVDDAIQIG